MGCILFEICYRRRAFVDDIAIRTYHEVRIFPGFSTSLPGVERIRCIPDEGLLKSVIKSMLSLNPKTRPTAQELCGTFTYVEAIPGTVVTPLPNRSIASSLVDIHPPTPRPPTGRPPLIARPSYDELSMPNLPPLPPFSFFRRAQAPRDPFDELL